MSGPKVVRVVTREEVMATCNTHLAQLDYAIGHWMKECRRLGVLQETDVETLRKVQEAIMTLMEREKFFDVQKRIPEEIFYLNSELERRRVQAAELAAQAIQFARQRRQNATALLRELARLSVQGHDDIVTAIGELANGNHPDEGADAILASGFGLLAQNNVAAGLTEEQRALAAKLAPEEKAYSLAEWKKVLGTQDDKRIADLERRLGEMDARYGTDTISKYLERMRVLESEAAGSTKSMKIDALVLDVAGAMKILKENTAIIQNGEALINEIAVESTDSDKMLWELKQKLSDAVTARDDSSVRLLLPQVRSGLDRVRQRSQAEQRRSAILTGLSELGYEIREGMETAWAENGRVVLKNPSLPGYGVEIGGASDATRLQVRAVAFGVDRDTSRDRDVETMWCGDFSKLQALVSRGGGAMLIEKSIAIGAMPLKVVDIGHEAVTAPTAAQHNRYAK